MLGRYQLFKTYMLRLVNVMFSSEHSYCYRQVLPETTRLYTEINLAERPSNLRKLEQR